MQGNDPNTTQMQTIDESNAQGNDGAVFNISMTSSESPTKRQPGIFKFSTASNKDFD